MVMSSLAHPQHELQQQQHQWMPYDNNLQQYLQQYDQQVNILKLIGINYRYRRPVVAQRHEV